MRMLLPSVTMALIFIFSLFCGCLGVEDQVIILDSNTPTFTVEVTSDSAEVQWYIDDMLIKKDAVPDNGDPVHFTLNRDQYEIGEHILKATDDDDENIWKFNVVDHSAVPEQKQPAVSVNSERGYDHFTPREERHVKAKTYRDALNKN